MSYLIIDTETVPFATPGKVRTDALPPALVAVGWYHDDETAMQCFKGWEARTPVDPRLLDLLSDKFVEVVFHNAAFDVAVLSAHSIEFAVRLIAKIKALKIWDTLVMHRLRDPDSVHPGSLEHLAKLYCNMNLEKGGVQMSFRPGVALTTAQWSYLKQDVMATQEIFTALLARPYGCFGAREYRWRVDTKHDSLAPEPDRLYSAAAAARAVSLEWNGLRVNKETLSAKIRLEEETCESLLRALRKQSLARLTRAPGEKPQVLENPLPGGLAIEGKIGRAWQPSRVMPNTMVRTWKGTLQTVAARASLNNTALREAYTHVAETNKLQPPLSAKTKKLSMEYDFWKQHRDVLPESLRQHLEYSKAQKILTAFLHPLRFADTVYPQYWIPGAVSGRWACSRPNLQQVPKRLREIYAAPPNYIFIGADYKSLELYTLAHVMYCMGINGPLRAKLSSGADIHVATAAEMYRCAPEAVSPQQRQNAKMANFGLGGGMGTRTFLRHARAQGADWSMEDAQEVYDRWFAAYPDVGEYLSRFKVSPYAFKPEELSRGDWLEELRLPEDSSAWDIRMRLDEGKWFDCGLPTGRRVPGRHYSAAANVFFQGTGADVITWAFVRCVQADLGIVAVVHDSIVIQCTTASDKKVEDATTTLKTQMAAALRDVCPSINPPPIETWKGTRLQ